MSAPTEPLPAPTEPTALSVHLVGGGDRPLPRKVPVSARDDHTQNCVPVGHPPASAPPHRFFPGRLSSRRVAGGSGRAGPGAPPVASGGDRVACRHLDALQRPLEEIA